VDRILCYEGWDKVYVWNYCDETFRELPLKGQEETGGLLEMMLQDRAY
jgi:hypothetical protein